MLKESIKDCTTRIQAWQNAAAHQQIASYASYPSALPQCWDASSYQGYFASTRYETPQHDCAGNPYLQGQLGQLPVASQYSIPAAAPVNADLELTLPTVPAQASDLPFGNRPYYNAIDNMYAYYHSDTGVSPANNNCPFSSMSSSTSTLLPEEQRYDLTFHPGSSHQRTPSESQTSTILRADATPFMPKIISHRQWLSEDIPVSPRTVVSPRHDFGDNQRRYSAAAVDLILYRIGQPSSKPKHRRYKSEYRKESAASIEEVVEDANATEQ